MATQQDLINSIEHLTEKVDALQAEVREIRDIWAKAQGMWLLVKLLVFIGGPILAVISWSKEHIS